MQSELGEDTQDEMRRLLNGAVATTGTRIGRIGLAAEAHGCDGAGIRW